MAEDKNSFIFYTDWEDTFRALPKDKGYDLLIHMLDYVNDRNPTTDDILINAVFQQLKNTLKRDLRGYEDKKVERSHSGRLGNLKRYHPDLYKKVTSDKLTLEAAEQVAIARKKSLSEKVVANLAVSDSGSGSVSVSDILLEKESKYDDDAHAENFRQKENAKTFLIEKKQIQMDRLKMKYKFTQDQLHLKIDEFIEKKFDWGDNTWRDENEMSKNFELWLDKNRTVIINPYKSWNEEEFKAECQKYKKEFGAKVLTDFFRYWNQPTETGSMRFQEKNAWNTEQQLKIWKSKNGK